MNRLVSLIKIIGIGPLNTRVNKKKLLSEEKAELAAKMREVPDLELLGKRLDAARNAYWRARNTNSIEYAHLYWQLYEQLAFKWKQAVDFYQSPKNSNILFELGDTYFKPRFDAESLKSKAQDVSTVTKTLQPVKKPSKNYHKIAKSQVLLSN